MIAHRGASVRVPASSANLGPGFDALGLALACYDEVTAEVGVDRTTVTVSGEGAGELPTDQRHLVVQAFRAGCRERGEPPPEVALTCHNQIPQARGLGSSSAAIVAGLRLARELAGGDQASGAPAGAGSAGGDRAGGDRAGGDRVGGDRAGGDRAGGDRAGRLADDRALLRVAARIEGHPDNVAPCLLGGLTIAWTGAAGAEAVRLYPHPAIRPTLLVPEQRGLTTAARAALPETVPHADAAHAAGRAALLVHALTREPGQLLAATEDRLHQPYRAAAAPATAALVAGLREAGVAAVVSGAGPSVLALSAVPSDFPLPAGWLRHVLDVDCRGAMVRAGRLTPQYTGGSTRDTPTQPVLPQVGRSV